jgi:SAM-dependent methyltransferase
MVLDVACGAGFGLDMLARAGACALGVDYDATALCEVRRAQPAARLTRGDATCLPLRDASVDLVVSFETIEHVPDAEALVVEIRRVLKPGGRLVLSTPNRAFGPPERHTGNPFHVREFTADELRALLRLSFEEVQLYGQRPSEAYRYVPFLMLAPQNNEPSALAWKLLVRLPFGVKNGLALALSRRPVYPGEDDYRFTPDACEGAHALVAVAC